MKRAVKILALVLAVLLLAGAVWYHIPIKHRLDLTLCSTEGQTLRLEGTVSFHRFFFRPTELRAEVTVDGIPYVDAATKLGSALKKPSFWHLFRQKWTGEGSNWDLYPRNLPPMEAKTSLFTLDFLPDSPNFSCVSLTDSHNGVFYYGPAETPEEAQALESQYLSAR